MTTVPTAGDYRQQLRHLLVRSQTSLTDEQHRVLLTVVRERRSWRRSRELTPAPAAISRQADEIVQLLESAAQVLRPRETQELDDLVAGREPVAPTSSSHNAPIMLHRRRGAV